VREKVLNWPDLKRQLIICGYPRSGTSMLFNMVASTLEGFEIVEGERSALQSIWKYGSYVSKCPHDVVKLRNYKIQQQNIHEKELLVLVITRDIRDVITSKHQWAPDIYMMGYASSLTITGTYPNYIKGFDGPGIDKYSKAIRNAQKAEGFHTVTVKYEDLVSSPNVYQDILKTRFALNFNGRFSDYYKYKERHGLRYTGSKAPIDESLVKSSSAVQKKFVGRWKAPEHYQRIVEQFDNYPALFDILISDGYETSTDWFNEFIRSR
jgi:hypothetical protein